MHRISQSLDGHRPILATGFVLAMAIGFSVGCSQSSNNVPTQVAESGGQGEPTPRPDPNNPPGTPPASPPEKPPVSRPENPPDDPPVPPPATVTRIVCLDGFSSMMPWFVSATTQAGSRFMSPAYRLQTPQQGSEDGMGNSEELQDLSGIQLLSSDGRNLDVVVENLSQNRTVAVASFARVPLFQQKAQSRPLATYPSLYFTTGRGPSAADVRLRSLGLSPSRILTGSLSGSRWLISPDSTGRTYELRDIDTGKAGASILLTHTEHLPLTWSEENQWAFFTNATSAGDGRNSDFRMRLWLVKLTGLSEGRRVAAISFPPPDQRSSDQLHPQFLGNKLYWLEHNSNGLRVRSAELIGNGEFKNLRDVFKTNGLFSPVMVVTSESLPASRQMMGSPLGPLRLAESPVLPTVVLASPTEFWFVQNPTQPIQRVSFPRSWLEGSSQPEPLPVQTLQNSHWTRMLIVSLRGKVGVQSFNWVDLGFRGHGDEYPGFRCEGPRLAPEVPAVFDDQQSSHLPSQDKDSVVQPSLAQFKFPATKGVRP